MTREDMEISKRYRPIRDNDELTRIYRTDPVVRACLYPYLMGKVEWEEALIQLVIVLSANRKEILDHCVNLSMRLPFSVPPIPKGG